MATTEMTATLFRRKQLAKDSASACGGRPYSEFTLIAWGEGRPGYARTRIGRDVVYRASKRREVASIHKRRAADKGRLNGLRRLQTNRAP